MIELNILKSILPQYSEYVEYLREDRSTIKWDERFLRLAKEVSTWSKDPSTKVGAVGVDTNKRIRSTGYNGFPRRIRDDNRLDSRDSKYGLIIHAEANCLLQCNTDVSTLYTWPLPPCRACALLIIQSGVYEVVAPDTWPERWNESINGALELFREAGVEVRLYNMEFNNNV